MHPLVLLTAVTALARMTVSDRYHPDEIRREPISRMAPPPERDPSYWINEAEAGIRERLRRRDNRNVARNIVMFLGDGMSVPTLAAARTLLGQRQGRRGEEAKLAFETFPTTGFSKTYCLNAQVADSACTATAYLCGVKANSGTVGVTGDVPRYDCDASADPANHVDSIAVWALEDGRDAGVVTTTRVTHASPAGVYAHVANRHWESDEKVRDDRGDPRRCPDIAHQLVHMSPGNRLKVILGGGRKEFLPIDEYDEEGFPGGRGDNRNLIKEWQANKQSEGVSHAYVWNKQQLMNFSSSPPKYLLGLFKNSHMHFHLEANQTTEPTLAEMTEIAIKSLSRNKQGFFLFVEGGRIDHAHHDNYVHLALDETIELSNAVEVAKKLLSEEDSLIVVTADHAHVMTFNGYMERGGDILGVSDNKDKDGIPYMTLSYSNGRGARRQLNGVRVNSETHGGDDVGVFARGPHHDMFSGVYEQSQLPHLMAYAGCIGPGLHACGNGCDKKRP
ncbi:hypothetical protein ABMA28_005479 [Loxostege sticticalis]|uniref:Alkaline phosphatase n=1 Tax=Loxostege sticticalis TaxID=481309 RepID=A0ABD0SQJ1_LOXSC